MSVRTSIVVAGIAAMGLADLVNAGGEGAVHFFLPPTDRVPRPLDVSDDGQTVVGFSMALGTPNQAFIWTPDEGYQAIPGMQQAVAVSSDGTIVVGIGPGLTAVRWTRANGVEPLPALPGGNGTAAALAVSPDGEIVTGGSSSANGPSEAFRIIDGDDPMPLGDLPGGVFSSNAYGVSADGALVVGSSRVTATKDRAFRWDETNGMVALPVIDGAFDISHRASAVSADGAVIIGSQAPFGVRWLGDGTVESLGALDAGEVGIEPNGVSHDGSVIVGNAVGAAAFRWTDADGIRDLNAVAAEAGIALGDKHLVFAMGVSADGRHIVGAASAPGFLSYGFLLTLPAACPADLDGSGDVGFGDLLAVLSAWGPCADCPEDLDDSGAVEFLDLLEVLSAWGACGETS